jgi:hypothetical protein
MVPTPPGSHGWNREFDLDLGGGPREFRKNQKNRKTLHGVMVSNASPRKNTKKASQWFTGGLFHKEVLPGRSSLGLPY